MEEVIDHHEKQYGRVPKYLYVDCGYCGNTLNTHSVAALWRTLFSVKLDAMLRIGREMNAKHPQRKIFLTDLSQAIFFHHLID